MQLYIRDKAQSCDERLLRFIECISEIENWMTSNRLKMNSDKTDFICLGSIGVDPTGATGAVAPPKEYYGARI